MMSSSTNPKIDELTDKTTLVQEEINKLANSLYKRLDSIYDTVPNQDEEYRAANSRTA